MMIPSLTTLLLALQDGPLNLPPVDFAYLGTRTITGAVMLTHMFFAQLFVGFAIGAPILQAWGRRKQNERMQRLGSSLTYFNIVTFSMGGTIAGLFLILLVGFYPRVASALFTHFFWLFPVLGMASMGMVIFMLYLYHYRLKEQSLIAGLGVAFFILIWQWLLTGIDTFMVTGGGAGEAVPAGTSVDSIGAALGSIFNPMFAPLSLHRTFGNLSWPAFAVAAWASFSYIRAKKAEDKAYFDWAGSMGVLWGTTFLLLQPFAGFAIAYSMKLTSGAGSYDRLVGGGTYTSTLLYINLAIVVGLFTLSNVSMYLGASRNPERSGRVPVRFFGLLAALAGLYSISPLAAWPFLYMRYIMMLVMVLATLGALIFYARSRGRFEYGSPGGLYRGVLLALGVLAVVSTLNMGFMKSNSRVPYTIYGEPKYKVDNERPIGTDQLRPPVEQP